MKKLYPITLLIILSLNFGCNSKRKTISNEKMIKVLSEMQIINATYKEKLTRERNKLKKEKLEQEFDAMLLTVLDKYDISLDDFRQAIHQEIRATNDLIPMMDSVLSNISDMRGGKKYN